MLLYNTIEADIVHIVQSCIAGYNMIIFLTFSYLDLRDVLHSHPPRQHHLASWPQAGPVARPDSESESRPRQRPRPGQVSPSPSPSPSRSLSLSPPAAARSPGPHWHRRRKRAGQDSRRINHDSGTGSSQAACGPGWSSTI